MCKCSARIQRLSSSWHHIICPRSCFGGNVMHEYVFMRRRATLAVARNRCRIRTSCQMVLPRNSHTLCAVHVLLTDLRPRLLCSDETVSLWNPTSLKQRSQWRLQSRGWFSSVCCLNCWLGAILAGIALPPTRGWPLYITYDMIACRAFLAVRQPFQGADLEWNTKQRIDANHRNALHESS